MRASTWSVCSRCRRSSVTDTLRSLTTSKRPWGQTVALVQTPLVNGMIFVVRDTAFIVGGPVSVAALDRVAADIVEQGIA